MPQEEVAAYAPRRIARSLQLPLRDVDTHVMRWGDEDAPKLFLLHGWMDVAASFQFLVDAFAREFHVIAPDLRGFGRTAWPPGGYWFPDYIADLDALLEHFAQDEKVVLCGHSLGANVVMQYAGARPARVEALIALDGFGIPAEPAQRAPDKLAAWLESLRKPVSFAPYANFAEVAQRLMKNDPRLPADKAAFLARHWAARAGDGTVRLTSDPRHKRPFPHVYRLEEAFAVWQRIEARTLWVVAGSSHIAGWLDDRDEAARRTDPLFAVRNRMEHVRDATMVTIADAGHMLHHDQPEAVARAIEDFLAR